MTRRVPVALLPPLLGWILAFSTTVARAAPARPNFLFIYSDDQRWDAMGVVQREQGERARFPWFQTPNMDRLAKEGVRFRNAFVVNSLCSPSRACFLTGRYNHLNGVANNHTPFPTDSVTYASLLRQAGYTTGYIGKWHMGNQSGQRPGFDYSASFVGQGQYFNCPVEVNGVKTPTKGWIDDVSTDYAINFLKQKRAGPFALVVGYKSPHGPWEPPDRLKDRYSDVAPKPPVSAAALPPYRAQDAAARAARPGAARGGNLDATRNYFRVIAGVDENLGRLLDTLDELKLTDNTVVVFTSDNGYYLGEHSLGDKRSAYDESMRIPMLVRTPKSALRGQVNDALVLNIDVAPTFLDLAGVPIPKAMQGASWRPLLENKTVPWRQSFFYEYFYERPYAIPTIFAVRTQTAKLVKYPGHDDWTELFDLRADPYEMHNLAGDATQRALYNQLQDEFQRQSRAVAFVVPAGVDQPEAPVAAVPARNAFVLDYQFQNDAGARVTDASGQGNHGRANGVPLVAGRAGRKARHFDGQSFIEVPKTNSLNPANSAWTVEAVIKAQNPNGVALARGGASQGYALYLEAGHPMFTVTANNHATTVSGPDDITGAWTALAGLVTVGRELRLYVNGRLVGSAALPALITKDPNETMQIGADNGSPVVQYAHPGGFVGDIESVRIYSGERTPVAKP